MKWALLLLGAGFVAMTFGPEPFSGAEQTDLPIYASYVEMMLRGELPYRDFGFEYPPLAAPVLLLGGIAGTGADEFELAFALLTFVLACSVVWLTAAVAERTGGDRGVALIGAVLALLACGALIRTRFDLAPVALTLAALLLFCRDRPQMAFVVVGVGALTKGFPLLVAPVAFVWLMARGEARAALRGAGVLAATLLIGAGVPTALSPDGYADSLRYHLDRPAQVESSPAVVLTLLEIVGIGEAVPERSFASVGLRHPQSELVLGLFAGLLAGAVALVAGSLTLRRPPENRELVLASLCAVAAFAVLGKVFSPQFMIWAAPLTALSASWRMYPLAAALALAQLLTLVEFPALYYDSLERNGHLATLVVGARNLTLVAAILIALRWLAGGGAQPDRRSGEHRTDGLNPAPGSAGSTWPGRLRRPRPARR